MGTGQSRHHEEGMTHHFKETGLSTPSVKVQLELWAKARWKAMEPH